MSVGVDSAEKLLGLQVLRQWLNIARSQCAARGCHTWTVNQKQRKKRRAPAAAVVSDIGQLGRSQLGLQGLKNASKKKYKHALHYRSV